MRSAFVVAALVVVSGCKKGGDEAIPVDNDPIVHAAIEAKTPKGCGAFFSYHYGEAYKTLREAEEYKAGLRDYYVRELSDYRNEYLNASISPNMRKEWLSSHKIAEKDQHCIVPLFDEIAAAAKRTLPKYRPRGYTHHESGEDDLILAAVKAELPDAEEISVGVSSPSWLIEKLGNGIPANRYKYGMAWVKSAKHDDGYCRIFYVNIVQDYAGGSSYGDSAANFIKSEPAGCK